MSVKMPYPQREPEKTLLEVIAEIMRNIKEILKKNG